MVVDSMTTEGTNGHRALIAEALIGGIEEFFRAKTMLAGGAKPSQNLFGKPTKGNRRPSAVPRKNKDGDDYDPPFIVTIQEAIDWLDPNKDAPGLSMKICCESLNLDPETVYFRVMRGGARAAFKGAIALREKGRARKGRQAEEAGVMG